MREASLTLALLLVFPVAFVDASSVETDVVAADLPGNIDELVNDMPAEAARFLESLPEVERDWARGGGGQSETQLSAEAARLRLRMLQLSWGREVTLLLRDGQRIKGELAEATAEDFSLFVPLQHGSSRNAKAKKRFRYEDVESAELPPVKGWKGPSEASGLAGRKVEVLLLNGERISGSLKQVTGKELTLERIRLKKREIRNYSLEEVASLRATGMKTSTKVIIGVGVGVGVFILLGTAYYYSLGA
jgi:small nuclear ribonucleoprotein (snRNP)-like protein